MKPPWSRPTRTRLACGLLVSVVLNVAFVSWLHAGRLLEFSVPDQGGPRAVRLERFFVRPPLPRRTPPAHWERLDRSSVRYTHVFPDHLQIVLQSAKRSDGRPSDAPNIYRVDISPAHIRERTVLHVRVFASPDANGVYVRFAIWELAVAPVASGRFDDRDADFPGKPYERFQRDYVMPPIPALFAGRSYEVQVAVVGRSGLASGAFVSLFLEGGRPGA